VDAHLVVAVDGCRACWLAAQALLERISAVIVAMLRIAMTFRTAARRSG
jgi:hypothetical protein